ncbi:DUF3152 domain-containing protein [Streptomyces sp. PTD5-9]|uniref:DUF3152 domain-containing protein n=1 Tax=Streptomyces sp. PTD5-9 TaxID=3120150 RepID=UPI00300A5E1B
MSAQGARRPGRPERSERSGRPDLPGPAGRRRKRLIVAVAVPAVLLCAVAAVGIRWVTDGDGKGNSPSGSGSSRGTGTFTVARAAAVDTGGRSGEATRAPADDGHGTGDRAAGATGGGAGGSASNGYRVEVEDGTGVDPDEAAAEIARVLADPRGWSHHGEHTFHQVADAPAGLVIRIATPGTTDAVCAKSGLDTHGEVNCRVGADVMVNLKRWQQGSPEFHGPLADYRALIVNHEVGHWLGHGHETCPGRGRPAPAMMQQIDGLEGCVSNAWPYDAKGRYLDGPPVP